MNKAVVLLLLFISSYQGFGQTRLGFKAGANLSTVIADKDVVAFPEYVNIEEPRVGYYVGVFSSIPFNKKLSLHPELLLSLKGFKTVSTHPDRYRYTTNLHYLNLPILLSYKPFSKFTLLAGPEFGLLLRAKYKGDFIEGWRTSTDYKKSDFGVTAGLNYDFLPKWAIEGRYSHGITYLTEYQQVKDTRNRVWQVGVAYTLK